VKPKTEHTLLVSEDTPRTNRDRRLQACGFSLTADYFFPLFPSTAYCLLPTAYYFLAGGATGAGVLGAALAGEVSRIEPDECRVAQTASVTEVHMKMPASAQVIFCMVVTAPRGPKAAWL